MSTAADGVLPEDETVELQKITDDPSTEWVSWKEAENELRQLDQQEGFEVLGTTGFSTKWMNPKGWFRS